MIIIIMFGLVACGSGDTQVEEPEVVVSEDEDEDETVEEVEDLFAADNEMLANWLDELISQIEEVDVESPLMFIATIGGIVSGTRSVLEGSNASAYAEAQIENILEFLEGVNGLVVQNIDDESLDLSEMRDNTVEALNDMRERFAE